MSTGASISATAWTWPDWAALRHVLTLQDYNTRVVMLGAMTLGMSAGIIGAFMLLRKRALLGDAISHATLPGIASAFLVMTAFGGTGKYLPGLLLGAAISGLLGMGAVLLIRSQTRIKEDAALGAVLSVFFGLGIALLGLIQKMKLGHAAGLESFIYGKTASMLASDAWLIVTSGLIIAAICAALFKEFRLLCFDQAYAKSQGWPVMGLDALMMVLVVAVTVIGLQAVGLILVIALLIIPPAAARFWTNDLRGMVVLSSAIGGASCLLGAGLSALQPHLPAGAVIVVVASAVFVASMLVGPARGILFRWLEHVGLTRKVARQHLLRALFEYIETLGSVSSGESFVPMKHLLSERSWSGPALRRIVRRLEREGLLYQNADGGCRLTAPGLEEARRVVTNHRLWEVYLITHADIAPSHVDRDADQIEHVLGADMVDELESLLAIQAAQRVLPASPHPLPIPRNP